MNIKNIKKVFPAIAIMALFPVAAYAATVFYTATLALGLDTALSLTKNNDIDFGTVKAATAATYRISTAGTVSVVSGSGEALHGTPAAGSITISGSTTQTISITANNYVTDNGVTPSAATCAYNGGGSAACTTLASVAAPAAGKTLLVGCDLAVGSQSAGTSETPTFDIVVAYN